MNTAGDAAPEAGMSVADAWLGKVRVATFSPMPQTAAREAHPDRARRNRARAIWPPAGAAAVREGAPGSFHLNGHGGVPASLPAAMNAGPPGHAGGDPPARPSPNGIGMRAASVSGYDANAAAAASAEPRRAAAEPPDAADPVRGLWRLIAPGRVRRRQVISGEVWRTGLDKAQSRIKRGLDLALLAVLALPAGAICLLCMLAIRLDSPGPALFAQWRTGKDGRRFRFWKLRTMIVDAQVLEERLRPMSRLAWPDFKIENDPRVTRLGRWLRRTSLDELPQLWNVLRGEMSLVGPRPTTFGYETWRLWHTERLAVPPGMTGLWQVLGRGSCSFDERLRQDLAYIRGWRLRLDLEILLLTVAVVITGKGGK